MTVESGIELGNYMADPKFALAYLEDVIEFTQKNAINLNRQITRARIPQPYMERIYSVLKISSHGSRTILSTLYILIFLLQEA